MTLILWPRRRTDTVGPRRSFVPRVTALEDRTVPTTFPVMNNLDSGPGSLRQAVLAANAAPGADTIVFAPAVHKITLTTGELAVTDSLVVQGPGPNRLTVSGNDDSRVFNIHAGTVTIADLTVARGRADGAAPDFAGTGGGILNHAGASLTLDDVDLVKNRAVGDPAAVTVASGVFVLAGGALGGAVANFGTLAVSASSFTGNLARGADDTAGGTFGVGPAFAGLADGGAVANFGSATVTASSFTGNLARAGDRGTGDFAAIAGGGAIFNDAVLAVTASTFKQNQAVAGDDGVSPFHNGHALGGALNSGSLLPLAGGPGATLEVTDSTFERNLALGGNDNVVTLPEVAPSDGPNNAYGGGILVYQGTATLARTRLHHNQAVGGKGGADANGSLGVGGGVFFYNFLGGVTAEVSDYAITQNDAVGGAGRAGGRGGDGLGGGVALGGLGGAFGGPGALTMTRTLLAANEARGARGGDGGDGGDGRGGGLSIDAGSSATVTSSAITLNRAVGGRGPGAGLDGEGIGGGVYNLGTLVDATTFIALNHASTSHDNRFG